MKILGIETSCDETAISIIETDSLNKISVLSNEINSQIDIHKEYGGVFPTLAKREHAKNIIPVFESSLQKAGLYKKQENTKQYEISEEHKLEIQKIFEREPELKETFIEYFQSIEKPDIDLIAVTSGPGLEPALWVGINFARALSLIWNINLIPVNHMEGHILSIMTQNKEPDFPAISLLISGGHTELILIKNFGEYEILGQTLDDAIGEAFDKTARLLGYDYPGGPEISKLAEIAREKNTKLEEIKLPRPMMHSDNYDFSFSGIKTAVLYLVQKLELEKSQVLESDVATSKPVLRNLSEEGLDQNQKEQIALEFENAVTEVIIKKTKKALSEYNSHNLIVAGGVIANKHIQAELKKIENINLFIPENNVTTDNAVMIAITGFYKSKNSSQTLEFFPEIIADGNLKLG